LTEFFQPGLDLLVRAEAEDLNDKKVARWTGTPIG
jgi:hypothetical protein